eukprot:CAMPEP_0196216182 /NCGR_PEP_ID=MMETSP0912-20130531/31659_1 /TAXON_ID=49265 /ORGANISM="Thalassiosira rotula, Strain GSO102" /LENGTH=54 /DNA_ID=CAMNT_0041493263 /DNA_START=74 /DNA_END=234 /DNA_ORIENTATION=+
MIYHFSNEDLHVYDGISTPRYDETRRIDNSSEGLARWHKLQVHASSLILPREIA